MNCLDNLSRIFPIRCTDQSANFIGNDGVQVIDNLSLQVETGTNRLTDLYNCNNNRNVLLTGPKGSCKTSFLVQVAKTIANTIDNYIPVISFAPLTRIPLHVHRMPQLNQRTARFITFHYINNLDELLDFVGNLYIRQENRLGALIVDDLESYFCDEIYKSNATRLFSLLTDTAAHLNIPLYAGLKWDSVPGLEEIAGHFFDEIWTIQETTILGYSSAYTMTSDLRPKLYFYVDKHQIFLDRICSIVEF